MPLLPIQWPQQFSRLKEGILHQQHAVRPGTSINIISHPEDIHSLTVDVECSHVKVIGHPQLIRKTQKHGKCVPIELIANTEIQCVNVHASLLARHELIQLFQSAPFQATRVGTCILMQSNGTSGLSPSSAQRDLIKPERRPRKVLSSTQTECMSSTSNCFQKQAQTPSISILSECNFCSQ